jgi:hypothetical protein
MAINNYTQAMDLSNLKKVESNVSFMTNSSGDKMTMQNSSGITSSDADTNNVSSSNKSREAIKNVHLTGMPGRNGAFSHSAEANSPFKNRGSEGSDGSYSCEEKPSFTRHQTTKNKDKKKRKKIAVSSESSDGASSFDKTFKGDHKKQKLQDDESDEEEDGEHDLTTPEGQMAMNPGKLTAKAAATEAKREYNRRNAARARKRNKHMVGDLQEKVHSLTKRTEDLQRSNDVLRAQLEVLQTQNRDLLFILPDTEPKAQVKSSSSNDIMSQLLEQLQGKGEAQQKQHQPKQQEQDITQLLNSLTRQGSSSQLLGSLQGGQQAGGNVLSGMQGQGNSQLLSALLGQSQAQAEQLLPCQQQSSNLQPGIQDQSMAQPPSSFGLQGQHQRSQQQQVSGATQDQRHLQQMLSSMPPEALYSMMRELSPAGNNDPNVGR